jgi:hypothetical protein
MQSKPYNFWGGIYLINIQNKEKTSRVLLANEVNEPIQDNLYIIVFNM